MTVHRLHNTVYAAFAEIAAAEKITRKRLAELSRDLLVYVPETDDIDIVNRLIGVLTPINSKAAILFFEHFLPWKVERDQEKNFVRFGKRYTADKKIKEKMDLITVFLSEEKNTIWTWAKSELDFNKKKDFAGGIARAISKAVEGDDNNAPLDVEHIFNAILDGGVSLDDILLAAMVKQEAFKEAEKAHLEAMGQAA